jgi:hypothetical protein
MFWKALGSGWTIDNTVRTYLCALFADPHGGLLEDLSGDRRWKVPWCWACSCALGSQREALNLGSTPLPSSEHLLPSFLGSGRTKRFTGVFRWAWRGHAWSYPRTLLGTISGNDLRSRARMAFWGEHIVTIYDRFVLLCLLFSSVKHLCVVGRGIGNGAWRFFH